MCALIFLMLSACSNDELKVDEKPAPPQMETEDEAQEEKEVKNEEASAQIAVVKKFIEIAYFDEGTYEDFTALYADPKKANTEEEFNEFRKSNEPKDVFPVDSDSAKDVSKHLVAKLIDETNADVYWLENVKKDKKEDAESVWSVTKIEDEWKIK